MNYEAVRKAIAKVPKSVVVGEDWSHRMTDHIRAAIPVETRWTAFLERHIKSIQKRMRSKMPADEVFTEEDRSLLDELFVQVTEEAKPYLASQKGYKPKETP